MVTRREAVGYFFRKNVPTSYEQECINVVCSSAIGMDLIVAELKEYAKHTDTMPIDQMIYLVEKVRKMDMVDLNIIAKGLYNEEN